MANPVRYVRLYEHGRKCGEIHSELGCVCPKVQGMGRWLRVESKEEKEKTIFRRGEIPLKTSYVLGVYTHIEKWKNVYINIRTTQDGTWTDW